mmetsp:Transcript_61421/g.194416  ORF Transcript_61421/g.194416 Transcript_61421/m.194416 type:complete len:221 (+) Transcript_61421:362-1024(+)
MGCTKMSTSGERFSRCSAIPSHIAGEALSAAGTLWRRMLMLLPSPMATVCKKAEPLASPPSLLRCCTMSLIESESHSTLLARPEIGRKALAPWQTVGATPLPPHCCMPLRTPPTPRCCAARKPADPMLADADARWLRKPDLQQPALFACPGIAGAPFVWRAVTSVKPHDTVAMLMQATHSTAVKSLTHPLHPPSTGASEAGGRSVLRRRRVVRGPVRMRE